MGIYHVIHPGIGGGATLRGGGVMIVSATDSADALSMAASKYGGDSGGWATATATLMSDVAVTATGALIGWKFKIVVYTATPKEFELTGAATSLDTLDEIGAALAVIINLDADIAGAAYNSTTQALTVAETTDGLGDMAVTCVVTPPVVTGPGGQANDPQSIAGFVASITDEGASGAALTVTFAADTLIVPAVKYVLNP